MSIDEFPITPWPWKPVQLDGHLDWISTCRYISYMSIQLVRVDTSGMSINLLHVDTIARNASHFTAKRASSALVTIERLSTKGHALIGRCDDLHRQAPSQTQTSKISEVKFLLVDFFPFFLLALASFGRFASADHLTVYFLVCRSLRVWMAGMFANLTIFFIVLLLVFREPSSWRSLPGDHVDVNINRRFLV